MPFTINGTNGLTFPDSTTQATRAVSRAGDTMSGILTLQSDLVISRPNANMSRITLSNTSRNWSISNYGTQIGPNNNFAIADETAAAVRFAIDSGGRVSTPVQPAFCVGGAGQDAYAAGSVLPFNILINSLNTGSHFNLSTSTFTAPIAGVYMFNMGIYSFNSHVGSFCFTVNGSQYGIPTDTALAYKGSGEYTTSLTALISLNANDTVQARTRAGVPASHAYLPHSIFSGYLLG
jgi:hypothetical protein